VNIITKSTGRKTTSVAKDNGISTKEKGYIA
jgi:hypothetical protein